jgi:tetratricopeptide (TPR) repeat protein
VWYFWFLRGAFSEGRQWLTAARATSRGTDRAVRATALIGAGFLQFMQADATPANERFHEGLALGHALGDPFTIAYALLGLGSVAFNQGAFAEAVPLLEESQAVFQTVGHTWGTASARFCLGRALLLASEYEQAATHLEASEPLFQAVGERFLMTWVRNVLGYVRYQQGRYSDAAACFRDALTQGVELGALQVVAECLEGLASVAGGQGQGTRAARLFGAAEALREGIGAPLAPADRTNYECSVNLARAVLDTPAFTTAWADGRTMPLEQVIAEALADDAKHRAVGMP